MSTNPYTQAVREFHTVFGAASDRRLSDQALLAARLRFIDEEVAELKQAVAEMSATPTTATTAMMMRELADVLYVVTGFAVAFGLPLEDAFARVHQANMSKLVDGKPLTDASGKILKGPNFCPPQLDDLAAPFVCAPSAHKMEG